MLSTGEGHSAVWEIKRYKKLNTKMQGLQQVSDGLIRYAA